MVDQPTVIIMAAGHGTRMRSELAKVLHPLCGRPMIQWCIEAAKRAGARQVVCVTRPGEGVSEALPADVVVAEQTTGEGTGAAVLACRDIVGSDGTVVVLSGDHPLISEQVIAELVSTHQRDNAAATLVTCDQIDPTGYGRIVRADDGSVKRIVETKQTEGLSQQELGIREVNIGAYAFSNEALYSALDAVADTGAERYLTDVFEVFKSRGDRISACLTSDSSSALGVNTRLDLLGAQRLAQQRIIEAHALSGVTFRSPETACIDVDVQIGPDTTIESGVTLSQSAKVGAGCVIGPNSTAIGATIGDGVSCVHSYLVDCEIDSGASIGPFAYLRPKTVVSQRAKVGTFVEVKNSHIGESSKVPHLSYVGDSEIGKDANIGAGNITANYDGRSKHRTVIGDGARTGVHTSFVAPVSLGDRAYTGAGSVITEDIPDDALGIARPRQKNIEGYAQRVEEESRDERHRG
jgi:bifunctional UDP-N-acetylglucosamine pyrophosphorylase/glucosamine-1-phosphate N-acetyltransferase